MIRWVLTIAVVMAPIAWGISLADGPIERHVGHLIAGACLLVVLWLSAFRSRPLYPQHGLALDEREIGVRRLAMIKGLAVASLPGPLLCCYMTMALQSGWWMPSADDWLSLLLVLCCWIFGLPLVFANWLVGAPIDEDDQ